MLLCIIGKVNSLVDLIAFHVFSFTNYYLMHLCYMYFIVTSVLLTTTIGTRQCRENGTWDSPYCTSLIEIAKNMVFFF